MWIVPSGALFVFDPSKCPGSFDPGDVVQLVGVEIQEWNGSAQFSGRNVSITDAHKTDCSCTAKKGSLGVLL
jgi:hypothetical protein